MTTLLKASGSAEFLSIVPSLAGFTPRRSVVLLPFQGKRTYGAMRLDLPRDGTDLEEFADVAIGLLARIDAADAVALVMYADDDPHATRDGLVLPYAVAVDELLGCATDAGLRIVDALCVTPSGWSSYLDDDPVLHPSETIAPAPPVPGIGDVSGDQSVGTELPHVDFAEKERVGRALRDLTLLLENDEHGLVNAAANPQAIEAAALLEDIPFFFESVLGTPGDLPPFAAAALLWCLDRPLLRDVAITQWASSHWVGAKTLEAQLSFSRSATTVPDELGGLFLGRGPTPDPDRLQLALAAVRMVAAQAPRASRPAPLTAAAWLSWALGRSTHAGHYLEQVREIDPDYGLAALLSTMINAAMLPEWAFRRGESTR